MIPQERQLEQELIEKLRGLKYEYHSDIRDRAALETNFRAKFEALNRVRLTDSEFQRLLDEIITPDVFTAARTLRGINSFTRDDGTPLNYTLVNIKDWCKNSFEVVSQLRINTDYSHHRYDVMLLINGVPVVQIELKTLGINPRRAMEQIVEYKNDPGNGYTRTLLCFVQLFIVSNRDSTYYFANNNARHFAFNAEERFLPIYQHAAEDNKKITHLDDFADKFLAKCTLAEMISRYMVLVASEQKLLIMRPYQIYAVKHIVQCIEQNSGNGYIWHTTGSGKTLTSFKASTLLKDNPNIEKCLFVVDRKDLDRQTREEFNRFQEGCVEENTNTGALVHRLLSEDYADKVIVTTIQKLGLALDENSKRNKQREKKGQSTYKDMLEPLCDKRLVFIFDECHRSQFGDNHKAIKEFFPKAQLFGFTGTPIFEQNATVKQIDGDIATLRTTQDLFQKELHVYTITHAIEDQNVLRFNVDYYKPDGKAIKPGEPLAKRAVVEAILDKHDAASGNRRFNALHATASINDAIEYFNLFKIVQAEQQQSDPEFVPLNIAAVFSPPANGDADVRQIQEDLPQEREDNQQDPEGKKKALTAIIADYNERFGTNHSISEFDLYYQDVQKRIKDQQFPILPHGVLFRGGAEERIRRKLLEDGHIDTVIGLPANLFYSTGIPVCILVLKRCKKPDDVLFINAAEHFVKGKRQNQLTEAHIAKIIETYQSRNEEGRYSKRVGMSEIVANDYNLNISRYVSTAQQEPEINLVKTHEDLVRIEESIREATAKHNGFLLELGLSPLPYPERSQGPPAGGV
jgi:type I restriction enzyme, R subunit